VKKLILIKLGGSVITDKSAKFKAKPEVISRLAKEIESGRQSLREDHLFLIGHGQGSFAHIPAVKYQTQKGLINEGSVKSFCETSFVQ